MGLLNHPPALMSMPKELQDNICIICNHETIPVHTGVGLDDLYQFKCPNCVPGKQVSLTLDFIVSKDYKLLLLDQELKGVVKSFFNSAEGDKIGLNLQELIKLKEGISQG